MYKKILLASTIATILFAGCSSKQYFEPQQTTSLSTYSMGDKLINYSRDGATLASGTILTKNQAKKIKLDKGFYFINNNRQAAITADLQGNCHIVTRRGTVASAKFPQALVAGTLIGQYLVYVLQNNNYGIYDFKEHKIVYNNESNRAYTIDRRVANPLLVDKLVVIPTLDGKLVVLDLTTRKITKEIFVSTEKSLNNIIFLGTIKNTLIAATPHKMISLSSKGKKEYDKEIAEVVINGGDIFVFQKNGKIAKLNELLSVIAEKKFKFAHFSAGAVDDKKVYGLEKQGYLIVANRNLSKNRVYNVPEVEDFTFVSGNKIYYNGEVIELSKLSYE